MCQNPSEFVNLDPPELFASLVPTSHKFGVSSDLQKEFVARLSLRKLFASHKELLQA